MKTIIGIVGRIGSGKDVVARYISNKLNIPYYQISVPIIELAKQRHIKLIRKDLTEFGTEIAKEKGEDYFTKVLLDKINDIGVIAGIRQLAQIDYLKKNSNLILISVDADSQIRFKRAKERNKFVEADTIEEFIQAEIDENTGPHIQRLFECMKLADYKIENNSDLSALYKRVDEILEKEKVKLLKNLR